MSGLVAASGDGELVALRALRDSLAAQLDECESARDYAALSLRFMDALSRISELESAQPKREGTKLDELAKRRAARRAGTAG